ncbi:MAG: N-acetyltransferase family protein [Rhodospirillaceae bacterium]
MKKPSFALRRATDADFPQLCELYAEVDAFHRKARPDIFRKARNPARPRTYIAGLVAGPDSAIFVADAGRRLAGFVVVEIQRGVEGMVHKAATIASIDTIGVRPSYRRLGLGRRLVTRACRWAQHRGATAVGLSVFEFNSGPIAFYEAIGFRTVARTMELGLPQR